MSIPTPAVTLLEPEVKLASPGAQRVRDLWRMIVLNRKVAFGLSIIGFFAFVAIFGPIIFRQDPNAFTNDVLAPPSPLHWLGTTQTGQDVFLQVVVGTRVSLVLGFVTGVITTIISVVVGLAGGYLGGLVVDLAARPLHRHPGRGPRLHQLWHRRNRQSAPAQRDQSQKESQALDLSI
ncbi:MAG TPA: hypothetical protein VKV40_16610 [Ktedonobacteraceae bacterium]|nr:hypothetical protein [Ktedonobacteraceae bacterium]